MHPQGLKALSAEESALSPGGGATGTRGRLPVIGPPADPDSGTALSGPVHPGDAIGRTGERTERPCCSEGQVILSGSVLHLGQNRGFLRSPPELSRSLSFPAIHAIWILETKRRNPLAGRAGWLWSWAAQLPCVWRWSCLRPCFHLLKTSCPHRDRPESSWGCFVFSCLLLFSPPLSLVPGISLQPDIFLGSPLKWNTALLSWGSTVWGSDVCQSTLLEASSGARPILLLSSLTPRVLFPFPKSSVSHLETLRQGLNGRTGDWLRKWGSPCRNKQKQGVCQAGERRGAGPEIPQSLELAETIW